METMSQPIIYAKYVGEIISWYYAIIKSGTDTKAVCFNGKTQNMSRTHTQIRNLIDHPNPLWREIDVKEFKRIKRSLTKKLKGL